MGLIYMQIKRDIYLKFAILQAKLHLLQFAD